MSRANIGIYGEELYEQALPLHGPDPDGLAHDYIGALTSQAIEIDDLARDDSQGRPGWGAILDIDACPIKGLPWLSQIAGVSLRDPKVLTDPVIPNANAELASTAGWRSGGTISGTYTFTVGTGLAGAGFHSRVTAGAVGGIWQVIKPVARAAAIPVRPRVLYGFSVGLHVTHALTNSPGQRFQGEAWFFDAAFNLISTTQIADSDLATNAYVVGDTFAVKWYEQAPAGAAYAAPGIRVPGMGTGAAIDSQVDVGEAIVAPIPAPDVNLVPAWPYAPQPHMETTEEWAEYARDAIRRQGGRQRGTPDAILSATEDTLKGAKVARLLERVGGNAYALELITRPSETPNPAATLAAAMAQKPAGMSLTHTLTEGVIINEGTRTIDTSTGTIDAATLGDVT
jgi:hypothetical protein